MYHSVPIVSIGLPVYNGEQHVRQVLDSLLAQDNEDFEIVIFDNASTDATRDICLEYAGKDPRIQYHRNDSNIGSVQNFNAVFKRMTGEYVMFAGHDDYQEPSYIRQCMEGFRVSKDLVLVAAACRCIRPETNETMIVEDGLSTLGLSPCERFKRYKARLNRKGYMGTMFYGIYRRSAPENVIPLRTLIACDHLMLGELCFHGEFSTTQKTQMVKRYGGASASLKDGARAMGLNNWFLVTFPWFVREVVFQRIIARSKCTISEKIRLSCWSCGHYIRAFVLFALRRRFQSLKPVILRPIVCVYHLVKKCCRTSAGHK